MCNAFILYFNRILRCFGKKCKFSSSRILTSAGILLPDDCWLSVCREALSCLFKCFHIFIDTVIWKKCHAILCQCIQNVCLEMLSHLQTALISVFCHYQDKTIQPDSSVYLRLVYLTAMQCHPEKSVQKICTPFSSIALRILAILSALDSPVHFISSSITGSQESAGRFSHISPTRS